MDSESDFSSKVINPLNLATKGQESNFHFLQYTGGVFHGCDYSKDIDINHVVQLVGYGTDDSGLGDYWLIRNSW